MSINRQNRIELQIVAREHGDGLIPGLFDLLCTSVVEGMPINYAIELGDRFHQQIDGDAEGWSNHPLREH